MRATDLLGRVVRDGDGHSIGRILDIRLAREDSGPGVGRWRVDGVVIGQRWSCARAGYAYGGLTGPLPLALLLRALGRHLRWAPWERLDTTDPTALTLRGSADDLPHPREA